MDVAVVVGGSCPKARKGIQMEIYIYEKKNKTLAWIQYQRVCLTVRCSSAWATDKSIGGQNANERAH